VKRRQHWGPVGPSSREPANVSSFHSVETLHSAMANKGSCRSEPAHRLALLEFKLWETELRRRTERRSKPFWRKVIGSKRQSIGWSTERFRLFLVLGGS